VPRVISLIASATEIVNALGAIDQLVGCSHECDYPDAVKSLPVCTRPRVPVDGSSLEIDRLVRESLRTSVSIYDVYDEVIERLQPSHILTQIQCEVCAVSLRDVEQAIGRGIHGQPQIVSLQPNSLADIWEDFRRVARALGLEERGDSVVEKLQARMQRDVRREPRPAVAVVEWIEPLMPAGCWTPELVERAGGINLDFKNWDDLHRADVVIIAPCGFDIARTEGELHWHDWSALPGSVYLADGNAYFNRPGPRVVETFEIIEEILHRDIAPRHRGVAWRCYDELERWR
jgi:iron complex transport system substrate-binding protein